MCANYRLWHLGLNLQHHIFVPHCLFHSNYHSQNTIYQVIPKYCIIILNFTDMRISFKCSIFGGVEVVFRFYFPLRTWVPLATWCNVTISLCEHRPLSGLDLGKGNILFSKGSSTFFVMLPLKFKGFSNILIYEF